MAGGDVAGALLFQARRDLTTEDGSKGPPPGKNAAVDPLLEAGHLPGNLDKAPRLAGKRGAELRQRAEQALCIGMTGRAEQLGHWRLLNLAARIHDDAALGDFSNNAEIMGAQN